MSIELIRVISKSKVYGHRRVTPTVLDRLIQEGKVKVVENRYGRKLYFFKEVNEDFPARF